MMKLLVVVDFQNDFVNGSLGFDGDQSIQMKMFSKSVESAQRKVEGLSELSFHIQDRNT